MANIDLTTLLLIVMCLAGAAWRLAGIRRPMMGHHLRTGPSLALAVLSLCAALFLAIPLTVIWGVILAAILVVCHTVSLWRMRTRTGPAGI